ncbi:MAG: T9SS type A sorting domain-containing protein [Bacteroidota bacterium]
MKIITIIAFVFLLFILWTNLSFAAGGTPCAGAVTVTAISSGAWDENATWDLGCYPDADDDVIINNGYSVSVSNGDECNDLTVDGATVDHNQPGNRVMTVNGNLTFSGNSAVNGLNQNNKIIVSGTLTVSAGAVAQIGGTQFDIGSTSQLDGELEFANADLGNKIFRGDITISSTGTWNNTNGEDPFFNCNITNNGSWIGCTGGPCTNTFGNETPGSYTITGNPIQMSVLSVAAATTVTNTSDLTVDLAGTQIITGNGTFTNGTNGILRIGGGTGAANDIDITTFNASTNPNTVYYYNLGNQSIRIPNDGSYYALVCSGSGTKAFQSAGTIAVDNLLTINDAAVVNVSTNTLNGAGGLTMTGTSNIQIAKITTVPELTGTYTLTAGTVTLNGAGAQTYSNVASAATCYNLILGNSGAKTINNVSTINGDLTVSGTATIASHSSFTQASSKTFYYNSTNTTTLTAATTPAIGNFSQSAGTLVDNGITITVNGASWAKSGGTYTATGTVAFNNTTGTEVSGASMTTFNNITINSGKTLKGHSTDMGLTGTWNNNSGTYLHNNGEVTMSGSASITGSETTFYDVELSGGTVTGHSTNMNVERNWTHSGGSFAPNNGQVTFTGTEATQTITVTGSGTETFYNLKLDKSSGTLTVGGGVDATDVAATNLVTISSGTFDMNTQILSGAGGLTMTDGDLQMAIPGTSTPGLTGTYTLTGGIITLDGTGAQTLRPSVTYFDLLLTTSGVKTLTNITTINGDITVSGTATLTGAEFTQASSKTFYYNSTGGTTTLASGITVGNYSQNGAGGTLDINGNTLTVTGNSWTYSAGTFTPSGNVLFQGGAAQSLTGATTFNDCEIDNTNGLALNNNMTVNGTLTFTSGNITTGANYVIIPNNASVSRTSGHVVGNLQKWIAVLSPTPTFEVGTGTDYTPIDFTFIPVTVAGYLACSTTSGEHPSVFSSTIEPNKSVNRYWTMTVPGGFAFTTYDAIFTFIDPGDVDGIADWNKFNVQRYDGVSWNSTTTGNRAINSTEITGEGSVVTEFAIGETVITVAVYTRVTGPANNWSNPATWIQYRTGTASFTNGLTAVTGGGTTLFTTELVVGDVLMLQASPNVVRGTIASITDDDNLTLTAPASATIAGGYGRQNVPSVTDIITNIGNPNLLTAAVDVILDVDATIFALAFPSMNFSNTLTHNAGKDLDMLTNVTITQPGNANTNSWNINAGTASLNGNLTIAGNVAAATQIARVSIATGTLTVGNALVFNSNSGPGQEVTAVLDISGGAATVNLSGSLTLQNSTGTLTPGASSTFNYNRTTSGQTVTFGSAITYNNLVLNNTSASGVTLGEAVTALNVTGDIRVQSGRFINGGFAIAGNGTFEVVNGATFEMTGTSVFPTGFGTYTFGATSTTEYHQTDAQTISVQNYGNLEVAPETNGITHTFAAGNPSVAGNFIAGNGTNTGIIVTAAPNATTLDVTGLFNISANTTFTANAANTLSVEGDWTTNGALINSSGTVNFNGTGAQQINGTATSQTFYNVTINKTAGQTLSVGGSTTTLTINDLTLTTGNFTAPATFNINGTVTLTTGTFTAGANINSSGNWTNNGGTFTHNSGTVTFDNTAAGQIINGSAASQTFYDVSLTNNGRILSTGGSTTTVTVNDLNLSATAGTFTSPATMNVDGNFSMSAGTYTGNTTTNITGSFTVSGGTFTAGTNTNIKGALSYDGGTFTPGSNTITLNGTSDQTIGGTSSWPNFNDLTINNTSGSGSEITLNKPITVDGTLTLTDGNIVTTSTNILSMVTSSSVSGGSDDSFVKGPMKHTIDVSSETTRIYPVGKGTAMHKVELTVTQTSATSTDYTGEFINSSAAALGWSLPGTIDHVSNLSYWNIEKEAGATVASASVKLYYFSVDQVEDAPNLRVAKGNPSAWIDIGGTGTATPSGTITSDINFTTFSYFALANKTGGGNPLPVELLFFDAKLNRVTAPSGGTVMDAVVDLTWATASETNNDYFTIQKAKNPQGFENPEGLGLDWKNVTYVSGAGNTNQTIHYSTVDPDPYYGISYYRLKQTDYDGKFTYSDIVAVNYIIEDKKYIAVYPNPSDGSFYVDVKGKKDDEVLVVVRDMFGKEFYSKVVILSNNGYTLAVDPYQRLSPGVYLVVASSNEKYYNNKIVIK